MTMWWPRTQSLRCHEEGQDLTEYALLFGLIVLLAIAATALLGESISEMISAIASTLASAL